MITKDALRASIQHEKNQATCRQLINAAAENISKKIRGDHERNRISGTRLRRRNLRLDLRKRYCMVGDSSLPNHN